MAYVNKATNNVSKPASAKPVASSKPTSASSDQPTHTLSVRCGEGDSAEFITLTGLFPGETKDGRSMMKGKPSIQILLRLEDGRELQAEQFFISAKQ